MRLLPSHDARCFATGQRKAFYHRNTALVIRREGATPIKWQGSGWVVAMARS